MLLFTIDGTEYEFDDDALSVDEALDVQKFTGLGIPQFLNGVNALDPGALKVMVWLTRCRAGDTIKYADVTFDVFKLIGSLHRPGMDESEAEQAGDDGEVPTTPEPTNGSGDGTTPPDAARATLQPSPSTSA